MKGNITGDSRGRASITGYQFFDKIIIRLPAAFIPAEKVLVKIANFP